MTDGERLFNNLISESQLIASIEAFADEETKGPRVMNSAEPETAPAESPTNQVTSFTNALMEVHKNTLTFLQWHLDTVRHLEIEVAVLREENRSLRAFASVGFVAHNKTETGGNGESFASINKVLGSTHVYLSDNESSSSQVLELQHGSVSATPMDEQVIVRSLSIPPIIFPLTPGVVPPQSEGAATGQVPVKYTGGSSLRIAAAGGITIQMPTDSCNQESMDILKQYSTSHCTSSAIPVTLQVPSGFMLSDLREGKEDDLTCKTEEITRKSGRASVRSMLSRRASGGGGGSISMRNSFAMRAIHMTEHETESEQGYRGTLFRKSHAYRGVFVQAEELKDRVRKAICKDEYSVHNFYHMTGFWQAVAKSQRFENITLAVIAGNALWMAVDTDMNDSAVLTEADPIFQIMEHAFCAYFTCELFTRFMAFRQKKYCLTDKWFIFDAFLVLMMILETWVTALVVLLMQTGDGQVDSARVGNISVLRLVRLARLVRMARMAKLIRLMPELMILIKGMMVATQTVFYTLCLLMLIIYVFAIAFMQMTNGTSLKELYFKDMSSTMANLLLKGILPDNASFVGELSKESVFFGIFMLIFILIGSLTVMNMLVGVLVEVVKTTSAIEKEQMDVNFVKSHLLSCIRRLDTDQDELISKTEFEGLLEIPEAAIALKNIGVDVVGLVDLCDYIFAEDQTLSFPQFIDTVLQLRGSNTATVKDIVDLRKLMVQELGNLEAKLVRLEC